MILITGALPIELKIIKQEIKNLKLKNINFDFLLTGVGNLNVVYTIKDYIYKNEKPDFILNIGVCGKVDEVFGDFFQVYRIKNLSNDREIICPIYIELAKLNSIACSDKIITNKEQMQYEYFVDMESVGIDFICNKEQVPYIILKKPFDLVGENSKKVDLYELENILKGLNYENILNNISEFLNKNKKRDYIYLQDIKSQFKLTFSEEELLKKYINKCIAFGDKKENIIKNIKALEKKELLKFIK